MALKKASRPQKRRPALFILAIAVAVAALAFVYKFNSAESAISPSEEQPIAPPAASQTSSSQAPAASPPAGPEPIPRVESGVPISARRNIELPPLPIGNYLPPRPLEVVRAVYQFAAEHPEVMNYVPCFCGCERSGHRANEDCFVASRDSEGRIAWDSHGVT